tara:strand:+ start:114 stop:1049 length:936 start_codon:yes stop_codon:yes gene_type:complete
MLLNSKTQTNYNPKQLYLSKYFSFDKYQNIPNTEKYLNTKQLKITNYGLKDYSITKLPVTSNASRNSYKVITPLPLQLKMKIFFYSQKSTRGRSRNGILCRTKGKLLIKRSYPQVCRSFRLLSLSFIANIFIIPIKLKLFSLVMSSSGSISYVNTNHNHQLFQVSKLYSVFENQLSQKNYLYLSNFIRIPQIFYILLQLPKYKFINSLETYPTKGIQYVKSPGSKAFINKIDIKLNLTLVKLPSGVHKVFSAYSVGSIGTTPLSNKTLRTRAQAGFFKKLGKKSLSRGVAKNPVDHPHGGRNKAIRYQRTP